MRDYRDAKAMAQSLREALRARSISITHSDSLELIAKIFGLDNWNTLAAKVAESSSADFSDMQVPPDVRISKLCSFCFLAEHTLQRFTTGPGNLICIKCVAVIKYLMSDEPVESDRLIIRGWNPEEEKVYHDESFRIYRDEELVDYCKSLEARLGVGLMDIDGLVKFIMRRQSGDLGEPEFPTAEPFSLYKYEDWPRRTTQELMTERDALKKRLGHSARQFARARSELRARSEAFGWFKPEGC